LLFADFKATLPLVSQAISEASFLAIDAEFSGIRFASCYYMLVTAQMNIYTVPAAPLYDGFQI
jgi:hypothetical protein